MDNDNNGIANDPRSGQQQEAGENAQAIEEKDGERHPSSEDSGGSDEHEIDQEALVEKILEAIPEEELERFLIGRVSVQQWQGLLPDPESFAGYPDYVQKQMVAWNDAQIIDESKRNDRITDAVISQKKWGQRLSFAIQVIFVIVTLASFLATNNPASFGFLAIPGVTIAINVWQDRKENHDE